MFCVCEKESKFQIDEKIHKHSFRGMVDAATKKALSGIPLMKTKAGPRDKEVYTMYMVAAITKLNSYVSRSGPPD